MPGSDGFGRSVEGEGERGERETVEAEFDEEGRWSGDC